MSNKQNQSLRTSIGWICVAFSTISWALIFTIPWLSLENPVSAAGVLYGMSYVFWFAALGCLGKEVLTQSIRTVKQVGHRTLQWFSAQFGLRFSSREEPEPHCEDDDA